MMDIKSRAPQSLYRMFAFSNPTVGNCRHRWSAGLGQVGQASGSAFKASLALHLAPHAAVTAVDAGSHPPLCTCLAKSSTSVRSAPTAAGSSLSSASRKSFSLPPVCLRSSAAILTPLCFQGEENSRHDERSARDPKRSQRACQNSNVLQATHRSTNSATCSKSFSTKPRLVRAGEPMRRPPGTMADTSPAARRNTQGQVNRCTTGQQQVRSATGQQVQNGMQTLTSNSHITTRTG